MNLRTLFWLTALSYTLVIGGSLLVYRLYVVFPAIEQATIDARMQNILAALGGYQNERTNLIALNRDWARWDDTYEFIENDDRGFILNNIDDQTFVNFDIDALAIINMQGVTQYAALKKNNIVSEITNAQDISADMDIAHILNKDEQYGIIRVNGKYGIYVSHHIQDSRQVHAPNGVLIYMRIYKPEFFTRIGLISGLQVMLGQFENVPQETLPHFENFKIHDIREQYYFTITNTRDEIIGKSEVKFPIDSSPTALDNPTLYSILALILLPVFITGIIYLVILIPIFRISKNIRLMKSTGNIFHLEQKSHIDEIDGFLITFNGLVDKIHMYQQKLLDDSNTDGLTGIYNRKFFDIAFDKGWRVSTRASLPLSIIMMDIDYFKKYNDYYGHLQGDEALKEVALALSNVIRRADDTLARFGGEEFVVISHASSLQHLEELLTIILQAVRELNIGHKQSSVHHHLTISCGACFIKNNGPWMKDLKLEALNLADEALYDAKHNGRNQYSIRTLQTPDQNRATHLSDSPDDTI